MEDLDILKQLYHGNHLEKEDIARARIILHGLNINLNSRV